MHEKLTEERRQEWLDEIRSRQSPDEHGRRKVITFWQDDEYAVLLEVCDAMHLARGPLIKTVFFMWLRMVKHFGIVPNVDTDINDILAKVEDRLTGYAGPT